MRIEQLIYLADIAQTGSITTTAQRVFLSQQAVSESIRNLEKELGYQLLNRSKTGVRLTQRGQLVTEYAQDIVQKYHDMISELATVVDTSSFVGNLTIASSPMVSKTLIPGVQEYLGKYHPDFSLQTDNDSNDAVIEHIIHHTAELGFFYYTSAEKQQLDAIAQQHSSLVIQKLFSNKLVYCVRKDSARFSIKDTEQDGKEKGLSIFFSADYAISEKQMQQWIVPTNLQYDSFLVSDNLSLIQDLILHYDAICAMPELTYRMFFNYRDYSAIPFNEEITDDLYCIYSTDVYKPHFDIVISSIEREIRQIQKKQLIY